MNKRDFIKSIVGIAAMVSTPAMAVSVNNQTKPSTQHQDPIWFTIWGTVFEIHQHHRTWHKVIKQELEATNISLSGLLAGRVGSKFEEGKCIVGFSRNHITTTAQQFIETGTEPCTQGVQGFLYRVQAPIKDRAMVEVQSMYVTQQGPELMITETPLIVASIGFDKYLLSCDNSEYQLHIWKLYSGAL